MRNQIQLQLNFPEPVWSPQTATEEELRRARSQVQWLADEFQKNEPTLSRNEAVKVAANEILYMWRLLGPQKSGRVVCGCADSTGLPLKFEGRKVICTSCGQSPRYKEDHESSCL